MNDIIPMTPRPSRRTLRGMERKLATGIDQSPNGVGSSGEYRGPAAQPMPVQGGLTIGRSQTHVIMMLNLQGGQIPLPFTPEQAESIADALALSAEAVRATPAEPEPEEAVYDEDEAQGIRDRVEMHANDYGKATLVPIMFARAFRHVFHARNWAAKHRLDIEPDAATGDVSFVPLSPPSLAIALLGPVSPVMEVPHEVATAG